MAQITYSVPISPQQRVIDGMSCVFAHLGAWKQAYDIDFISAIHNGANLDVTFSDPIPQNERDHCFGKF